jgi:hypothetical protein
VKESDTNNNTIYEIPSLDYAGDGFDKAGVTILFGGDHGDKNCPISCKINLSPPTIRKQKKNLGYQCPVVNFANIECSTDSFELLESTIMPIVKQQLTELRKSAMLTVFHRQHLSKTFRSYMVPSSIRSGTIAFSEQQEQGDNANNKFILMSYSFGNNEHEQNYGSIRIDDPVFFNVPFFELGTKLVISSFNELFIGDLAFLAMLIGMNHSSSAHCLMCMLKKSEFNCAHGDLVLRTKETMEHCLEQYLLLVANRNRRAAPPNYMGVNAVGLWDIDPQRIIIPILHCPMGLVDKVLESFRNWMNLEVEDFRDAGTQGARSVYQLATANHQAAIATHTAAKAGMVSNPMSPLAKEIEDAANKARIKAKKAETKSKKDYLEQVQKHNAKKSSLNQKFENVFRKNGVKREHYHGGKFNGVNCIRIMEKSSELLTGKDENEGFLQLMLQSKTDTIMEETVEAKCSEYSRLLGLLDAIWSTVRGIDAGLLPTNQQTTNLAKALDEAKKLWLAMKLSTLQPKWHLTFDGHLLDQFKRFGGLADKSDETIEKGHQTLKSLRDRFRGITSYKNREMCIRRELRRVRSPEIKKHIDDYESKIKQKAGTKREIDTIQRQTSYKTAKKVKREGYSNI